MPSDSLNASLLIILGLILGFLGTGTLLAIFEAEDFASMAMVLATVTIAIFTVAMAFLQWLSARTQKSAFRANYKVSLHEKRTETFHAAQMYLAHIRFGITTNKNLRDDARRLISTADFIFPISTSEYLVELIQKCDDYELTNLKYERYVSRSHRPPEVEMEIEKCLAKIDELDTWFAEYGSPMKLKSILGPHLTLPPSI